MSEQAPLVAVPAEDEYLDFYAGYVRHAASGGDVLAQLAAQPAEIAALLGGLSDECAMARYAPGKWSIKEVLGHIADTERIMAYRALRIARGDGTPLPGFDQDLFIEHAGFDARPLAELLEEWEAARRSTLALFRGFTPEAVARAGTASGGTITVRALAHILVGHVAHHLEILRTRYPVG